MIRTNTVLGMQFSWGDTCQGRGPPWSKYFDGDHEVCVAQQGVRLFPEFAVVSYVDVVIILASVAVLCFYPWAFESRYYRLARS